MMDERMYRILRDSVFAEWAILEMSANFPAPIICDA